MSNCAPQFGLLGNSAILALGLVNLLVGHGFGESLWTIIAAVLMRCVPARSASS